MATAKKTQIVITANAAVAKKVMDELAQRTDAIKQKMAGLDVTTKQGQREFKKLEKELVSYNSAISQNVTNTERISKAMKNLSGTSLNELKRALSAAKSELGKMSANDKGLKQMQGNVKALQTQIDKLTGSVHRQGGAWNTALKNLTAYVGLFGAFNMVKQKLTDIITLNLKYSDSLANVRKVSNLSMDSVNELSKMLAKVDSRTSLEGLTQLAYVGSRMGMGKYGAEGLAEFAKASDRVNVALKEDLGDDAMLTLSKFVETMGEVEKHGGNISNAFDAVSSSIFKLASTSTANGNNILEFAKRLTGLSKVSHITSDQLLGLASASDSLMLMPEVASTAFGKLISSLWTNYHEIEKMLGMQEDSLKGMMEKGQTMQALVTVLQNVSDKNLNSMDEYFKEFGSDGQRLKQVVVTMAQNVDVLKDHLKESSEAYKDATAVGKEYAIQQETAQAIVERANNMWNKAFVNPDGIDAVKEMAKAWYDFSKTLTTSSSFMMSAKILIWEIKKSVEVLLFLLPGLVAYLGTRGLVWAFSKLIPLMVGVSGSGIVSFFTILTNAVMGSNFAVGRLIVSWRAMSLAMKTNVIGLALSVVASLAAGIYQLVNSTNEATSSMKKFDKSLDGVYKKANQAVGELDGYYRAITRAGRGTNERTAAIKQFNDKFGTYLSKLVTEKSTVQDLAKAYREAASAIRAKIYLQMREDDIKNQYTPRVGWSLDRLNDYGKIAPKFFGEDMLKAYEEDSRNKTMTQIIGELSKKFGAKNISDVLRSEQRGLTSANRQVWRYKYSYGSFRRTKIDEELPAQDQQLFKALRYIRQARSANNTLGDIYDKYNPVDKEIDAYLKSLDKSSENLSDGKDTGGGKTGGGKGGHNGSTENKEVNQAKTRANALVSNIKAFYEEQKRKYLEWVTMMNADGEKVSEGQQKQMVDYLDTQMNTALGKAKQSISTLDDGWKDFLATMKNDIMVKPDEVSSDLLEAMGKSDVKELHDLFEKLSGDLSKENHQTLSENLGALLDQIFANGSKELREAAERLLAQQREIQKILNENDYTGAVNRSTRSNFDTLGLLKPAKTVKGDTEEGLKAMNDAFDKLTAKARSSVAELYRLNPESETFRESFLQYLSVANEGFDFSTLNAQKLKALYIELIKYTDDYTSAEKQAHDAAKKVIDQAWSTNKRNLAQQEAIRKMQNESNLFGKRTNLLSNLGLANLTADPEVELMKARMQAAEDYYAFVKANTQNMQLIREADDARQQAELNYANQMATAMKSRLSQMKELVQPIEDFGSAVGQALATMKDDADSANEAIKSALKSMLESWGKMALNDVNTQMWKAINDAGAKRGKAKAQPDIDAARKNADANAVKENLSDIGTAGNPAHVIVDNGISVDANGNPVSPNANGSANTEGAQQPSVQPTEPPVAWQKRNPGKTMDDYNREVQGIAGQTGTAIADVATGNSSIADAGADIAMSGVNAALNADLGGGKKSKKEDKERKKALKEEKKHQKELTKETKKGLKDREKANDKGVKKITDVTTEGNKEQSKNTEIAQNTIVNATDAALNATLTAKQKNNDATLQSDAQRTQGEVTFSIAGAMAKCFEFLGPIAGPVAAAVVMSTLMGLLQWALSSAMGGSSKKSSSSSSKNTKLVSGMLTYDSGNVQDLKPFVGDNGEVYWATEQDKPQSGVNLLTTPTATIINGQRSLVAENGPELVVGRETTKAMMMNNPSLLKALVNYDSNYSGRNTARRTFDEGNVGESVGNFASGVSATDDLITNNTASNAALLQAVNALLQRLNEPISAKIDMYGRGNLYDSMTKANQFMKGKI